MATLTFPQIGDVWSSSKGQYTIKDIQFYDGRDNWYNIKFLDHQTGKIRKGEFSTWGQDTLKGFCMRIRGVGIMNERAGTGILEGDIFPPYMSRGDVITPYAARLIEEKIGA